MRHPGRGEAEASWPYPVDRGVHAQLLLGEPAIVGEHRGIVGVEPCTRDHRDSRAAAHAVTLAQDYFAPHVRSSLTP